MMHACLSNSLQHLTSTDLDVLFDYMPATKRTSILTDHPLCLNTPLPLFSHRAGFPGHEGFNYAGDDIWHWLTCLVRIDQCPC